MIETETHFSRAEIRHKLTDYGRLQSTWEPSGLPNRPILRVGADRFMVYSVFSAERLCNIVTWHYKKL